MRAHPPVDLEHQQRGGEHRERYQHHHRGEQRVPGEDRHPEHRHAGRAHAEDRGDEVDPGQDGAQTGQHQAHDPHVGADAGRVDRAGQRGVRVPAERRRAARGQEAGQQDQPAEGEHVVAEQVEPRERHVGRADLQRDQLVREPDEQRRAEQQQHQGAVHGEQLVVLLIGHDVLVRAEQLDPHDQRHDPGAQEEEERRDQVQVPDDLVVGRGQPEGEDVSLTLGPRRLYDAGLLFGRAHGVLPRRLLRRARSRSPPSVRGGAPGSCPVVEGTATSCQGSRACSVALPGSSCSAVSLGLREVMICS